MARRVTRVLALILSAGLLGCEGKSEFQLPSANGPSVNVTLPTDALVGVSGLRRLTRTEYDSVLRDLLGDNSNSGFAQLPADPTDPFDNNYTLQQASAPLIESAEALAGAAADRALADPAKRDALVQCTPSGPGDAVCLRKFVSTFGRRAFRRALSEEEIQRYLAFQTFSVERGDFFAGVNLTIRAMLQDPEFLYRIEFGSPVEGKPGVFRLNAYELATRLAFFIWGSTPPDWLLDLAEQGGLATTPQIRAAAQRLLGDARTQERVDRFHALWLGYHQLPHSAELTNAMRAESGALVKRTVFERQGDYFDLFRATDTYANELLASQYGLTAYSGSGSKWVPYTGTARKGILSHGAYLAAGRTVSDTSPTQRGKFVRNRLLCQEIGPPPPGVNVDQPPTSTTSPCKVDRYAEHASSGTCKSCHGMMDPIGFGLENYDREGRFRATDDNLPQCAIAGDGELEIGKFNGPSELADLLIQSGRLEGCVTTQVYRFAMGRRETPRDAPLIESLALEFQSKNRNFSELMLDLVSDETFAFRMEE
jgi:hypothetical protein